MFIVSFGYDKLNYTINSLEDVSLLLSNEDFLSEYGDLFGEVIVGYEIEINFNEDVHRMTVEYWEDDDIDEVVLYLHKVKLIEGE